LGENPNAQPHMLPFFPGFQAHPNISDINIVAPATDDSWNPKPFVPFFSNDDKVSPNHDRFFSKIF